MRTTLFCLHTTRTPKDSDYKDMTHSTQFPMHHTHAGFGVDGLVVAALPVACRILVLPPSTGELHLSASQRGHSLHFELWEVHHKMQWFMVAGHCTTKHHKSSDTASVEETLVLCATLQGHKPNKRNTKTEGRKNALLHDTILKCEFSNPSMQNRSVLAFFYGFWLLPRENILFSEIVTAVTSLYLFCLEVYKGSFLLLRKFAIHHVVHSKVRWKVYY